MSWGKWIVFAFVFFGVFIITLVTVCVKQDINLVSKSYYQDELVYQQQIERIKNADALASKPDINVVGSSLEVRFSEMKQVDNGEVKLFRPSDASLDQSFSLTSGDDTIRSFELKAPVKGLYRAQMRWMMYGREYYFEKIISI